MKNCKNIELPYTKEERDFTINCLSSFLKNKDLLNFEIANNFTHLSLTRKPEHKQDIRIGFGNAVSEEESEEDIDEDNDDIDEEFLEEVICGVV